MPDKEENYNYDDEIDLREIFATLGKWKRTIIGVTLACMLVAGMFTRLMIDPIYEARVTVAPATQLDATNRSLSMSYLLDAEDSSQWRFTEDIDRMIQPPQVDTANFNALLTCNHVLKCTIEQLGLKDRPAGLRRQVEIKADPATSTTEISVKRKNPDQAAAIANTVVEEASKYMDELNMRRIKNLQNNLEKQVRVSEQELEKDVTELQALKASGQNSQQQRLQRSIQRQEQLLDILAAKAVELNMLQSFQDDREKIIVLSPATAPHNPVSPNLKLNVVIAGVLGLMLSVFGVFLAEYLRKDEKIDTPEGA